MPQPVAVEKAHLIELWPGSDGAFLEQRKDGKPVKRVTVQFNPQTLKTNYSNQNANTDKGSAPVQFVGKGTTKLTMELWFDATRYDQPGANEAGGDVRNLTDAIKYFITPQEYDPPKKDLVPPGVRFHWGSLLFEGVMDSMDETIELFSKDGVPLRASVSIGISRQEITIRPPNPFGGAGAPLGGGLRAGTTPLQPSRIGDTLQQIAARAGVSDWQRVAAANGIENPRLIAPGTLVNLSVR
jgi:hypothetical protein